MAQYKNSGSSVRFPVYISIAICIGILIGSNLSTLTPNSSKYLGSVSKFKQIMTFIENDYVDEVNTDNLTESVIKSMLEELDPHTSYIPAKDLPLVQSRLEGKYEGIGIEFNIFKDTIHVVSPLSGGPSEKLGIKAGDKIITVDGKNVAGINMTHQKVVEMLRGEGGTIVTMGILRRGESRLLDFEVERDVIPQFSVDVSYMVDDEIGYIKITRFANSTYEEFKEALMKLKQQGLEKLILDLTSNPGGYLDRAIEVTDELLGGEQLIVYTDGKKKRYTERHYSGEKGMFEEGMVTILVDEGSASASEIVAGAIQDHDRGFIVGRRTFGKGLVQLPLSLNDGSELRLTISRYYTPSGRSIQKTYEEGNRDAYYQESFMRYQSGELYNSDSIKVIDSLSYTTDNGRVVYGGGGIVPDFFVALDTLQDSRYLNRLFSSNTIQEFTVKYAQDHEEELIQMGLEAYINSEIITGPIMKELVDMASKNGLPLDQTDYEQSKRLIKKFVKAYIARGVWGNDGFYPIYNNQNEIFLKALRILKENKKPRINN